MIKFLRFILQICLNYKEYIKKNSDEIKHIFISIYAFNAISNNNDIKSFIFIIIII